MTFENGPYTQAQRNPRIPPQEVTERKAKRRIWLYLAIPVTFIAGYFFGTTSWLEQQPPEQTTITQVVPECENEDGSTQQICFWSDGSGDILVNMEYGQYSYNITRGTLHTYWTEKEN